MIKIRDLVKRFGSLAALRGIDLDVSTGESVAIVGPNGAGKTTLFRILATLDKPTAGTVRIAGFDLANGAVGIRRQIGFLSHQPLVYEHLSADENLRFYGRMYDVADLEYKIADVLEHVGLAGRRRDLVRTYSRGMKQRLAIARVLLHDPSILLLDEPYTGLDQQAEEMLDTLLHSQGWGSRTVLLSTHNLGQALWLSSRIVVLHRGRILYQTEGNDWDADQFRQIYRELTASQANTSETQFPHHPGRVI